MRDEALLHFHQADEISPGVHIRSLGGRTPHFLSVAAPRLDRASPGKSAAGFCATFFDLVADLKPPPPPGWRQWGFADWDNWFGRINGVFLVNLTDLSVVQFPMFQTYGREVPCDFSALPGRLSIVEPRVA
jgi:hypothetical protein